MSNLLTTEQWPSKAEEVRLIAKSLRDETARILLSIAAGYERLAEHAALLAASVPPDGNLEPPE